MWKLRCIATLGHPVVLRINCEVCTKFEVGLREVYGNLSIFVIQCFTADNARRPSYAILIFNPLNVNVCNAQAVMCSNTVTFVPGVSICQKCFKPRLS